MIRCVRLFTAGDGDSHFEEGLVELSDGAHGGGVSQIVGAVSASFRESPSGACGDWHNDPLPQYVITFGGVLEFETRGGKTFVIRPGDVLLAEEDSGTGHRWKLIGDDRWRRAYVVLQSGSPLPFKSLSHARGALA